MGKQLLTDCWGAPCPVVILANGSLPITPRPQGCVCGSRKRTMTRPVHLPARRASWACSSPLSQGAATRKNDLPVICPVPAWGIVAWGHGVCSAHAPGVELGEGGCQKLLHCAVQDRTSSRPNKVMGKPPRCPLPARQGEVALGQTSGDISVPRGPCGKGRTDTEQGQVGGQPAPAVALSPCSFLNLNSSYCCSACERVDGELMSWRVSHRRAKGTCEEGFSPYPLSSQVGGAWRGQTQWILVAD